MKETILIKQCPAIQLAHLYEHLFCSEVDKLFYENGLFPYVDYSLSANTHQTGIIYINLETYTDLAKEFSTNIENIKLSFSDEALSVAASQLIAENEFAYTGSRIDDIKKHLKSLDDIAWQDIDTITSISTKGIKRQSTPFYIDTRHPLPAKKLFLTMAVDERAHENIMQMLPLLRLVSFLISDTYETILSDRYGLYSLDGEFKNSNKLTGYQSVFNVPNGHLIDKKEVLETVIEIIEYISLKNGFGRFVEELKDISYKSSSKVSPNALHGLTDTGILMGSEGWKELSSMNNIYTILKSLTLTIRTGSDKVSQKLTLSR